MIQSADRAEAAERKLTTTANDVLVKMAEAAEKANRLHKRLDRLAWSVIGIGLIAGVAGGVLVALFYHFLVLQR